MFFSKLGRPACLIFLGTVFFVSNVFAVPLNDSQPLTCSLNASCRHPVGNGEKIERQLYAGLVWFLDGQTGLKPDLDLGVRGIKVHPRGAVQGMDLNIQMPISIRPFQIHLGRLLYVVGNTGIAQANLGAGFSVVEKEWLGVAAFQTNYARVGVDYWANRSKWKGYFEANTLKTYSTSALGCTEGALLLPSAPLSAESNVTKQGWTCVSKI